MKVTIGVSVDIDRTVEELYEIGSLIDELKDLVPEWSQLEAETIEDDIFRKLESLIMTRRISRQALRDQSSEPVFSYTRDGATYTIYKFGQKVDAFDGKDGLGIYGLEDDTEFTFTKNGTWYTVYGDGEEVEKFQGKDKLAKYGLEDGNNES